MQTLVTAGVVVGMVVIGVIMTLTVSWVLSKTALKGFRPTTHLSYLRTASQKFGIQLFAQHDKSIYVLKRAIVVLCPCGCINLLLANILLVTQAYLCIL